MSSAIPTRFFAVILLLLIPAIGVAGSDYDGGYDGGIPDVQVPAQPPTPAEQVSFDPAFLSQIVIPENLRNFLVPTEKIASPGSVDPVEREFAVFIEIFRYFVQLANEFQEDRDKYYSRIGDFRAFYEHALPKAFPSSMRVEVDAFQMTTQYQNSIVVQTTGGGAGMRVDLHPAKDGTLSFTFMPLYGEKRDFNTQGTGYRGGSDFILRTSAGVAYRQKLGQYVEPGMQVFFQPQMLDYKQFRIYAEVYVRFKILSDKKLKGSFYQISEVALVPKLVYWQSTDVSGVIGDPIEKMLGTTYYSLGKNLYGLMNLEFHFGM